MPTEAELLDRMVAPLERALSPEIARKLLDLRADPDLQTRIEELADRCTEGQLSNDERAEYQSMVSAANLIAILKAKAQKVLTDTPAA